MILTHALEADLATTTSVAGAATVVALPPSSYDDGPTGTLTTEAGATLTDEAGVALGLDTGLGMRVYVSGALTYRAYDTQMEQP